MWQAWYLVLIHLSPLGVPTMHQIPGYYLSKEQCNMAADAYWDNSPFNGIQTRMHSCIPSGGTVNLEKK